MIEVAALLIAGIKLGRALIDFDESAAEDASTSLAIEFLKPFLQTKQSDTPARLDRLQQSADRIESQRYQEGISVGRTFLADAAASGRSRKDQLRMLRKAHDEFRAAAATGLTLQDRVTALSLIAVTWIARGSLQDAENSLVEASRETLADVQRLAAEFNDPPGVRDAFMNARSAGLRLRMWAEPGLDYSREPEYETVLSSHRQAISSAALSAVALHGDVSRVRASLTHLPDLGLKGLYSPTHHVWLGQDTPPLFLGFSNFQVEPYYRYIPGQSVVVVGEVAISGLKLEKRSVDVRGRPSYSLEFATGRPARSSLAITACVGDPWQAWNADSSDQTAVAILDETQRSAALSDTTSDGTDASEIRYWWLHLPQIGTPEQLVIHVLEEDDPGRRLAVSVPLEHIPRGGMTPMEVATGLGRPIEVKRGNVVRRVG